MRYHGSDNDSKVSRANLIYPFKELVASKHCKLLISESDTYLPTFHPGCVLSRSCRNQEVIF